MIRKIELVTLGTILLGIAAFSVNWVIAPIIHLKKDVLVPDLVGKSVMEALRNLSQQNLGLREEGSEHNESVPAGTVLRQQPAAGISVREGKIIRVTISQGGESIYVPDLVGRSIRAAEIEIRSHFLALGEVRYKPSLKFEKDAVLSHDPPANTIVSKNSLVHLTVSNGTPEDGSLLLPDFVGKNLGAAESWAKETGIQLEMSEDPFASSEPDTILQQTVPPDTALAKGQSVKLIVSPKRSGSRQPVHSPTQNFYYEVPQGESAKEYIFVLVDSSGRREIFRGALDPGTKKNIPLPVAFNPPARVQIFVNGILTEERTI